MYRVDFSPEAIRDLDKLRKSEPNSFKKLNSLIGELQVHPKTGQVNLSHYLEIAVASGQGG